MEYVRAADLAPDATLAVSGGTRISMGMLSHYGHNVWWNVSDWVHGEATLDDGEAYSGTLRFVRGLGASMVELMDGRVFREDVVNYWRVE